MLIAGDPDQDRLALEILTEVEAVEANDIARWEAIQVVADRRNFGEYGIEQLVELGETVRGLDEAHQRLGR